MNMAGYYFEHACYLDEEVCKNSSFTAASPEFSININLYWMPLLTHWYRREDSTVPQLLGGLQFPMTTAHVCLNLEQFLSRKKTSEIIGDAIKYWPLPIDSRQRLINFALNKARQFVISMPPSHNAVHLFLPLRPELKHVFDEGLALRYAIRQSLTGARACMVPAAESSIESLESTTLMESGNCTICLEEFVNGGEGVMMPCSHVFHGDCIKKWLRTSHYCPVCRFEMPIPS